MYRMEKPNKLMNLDGNIGFRQRIVLASLTGNTIALTGIHQTSLNPGIKDYELNYIQLIEKITNGSVFTISSTGTKVIYKPGVIIGGDIVHECSLSRGIGYFLEPILALAPFTKTGLNITLKGVTNNNLDISVDIIRTVLIPLMSKFSDKLLDIEFTISKRGAYPKGGGEVIFKCPFIDFLKPVELIDSGKISRIRGIAYSTRMSPQIASRAANAARGALTKYIPDVYVYTDTYKGVSSGLSPGYALALVAESTTGSLISAELSSCVKCDTIQNSPEFSCDIEAQLLLNSNMDIKTPEDLANETVAMLLKQINEGGYIDAVTQWLVISLSVFNIQGVSSFKLGKITDFAVNYLRDLDTFFNLKVKIETCRDDSSAGNIIITIPGIDYYNKNITRK